MRDAEKFIERLDKIGIKVELTGNYPWVYLTKICGISVKEKRMSNHSFTVFLDEAPLNLKETFNLIRSYGNT